MLQSRIRFSSWSFGELLLWRVGFMRAILSDTLPRERWAGTVGEDWQVGVLEGNNRFV